MPHYVATRSIEELLAGATQREPLKHADSKSGAAFERVVIDGRRFVVKHFTEPDWLADAARDRDCRSVGLYESGVYDLVEDIVDTTVVGAARLAPDGTGWPAALLMRDAGDEFVAEDAAVSSGMHEAFITAMAALHAHFWAAVPDVALMDLGCNYEFLSPQRAVVERDRDGDRSDVLRAVLAGWRAIEDQWPETWAVVRDVLADPSPLAGALERGPQTLLHGDWKMGNIGQRADGRVVLVDWDRPSAGPPVVDLAWYLGVNCDRLPETKEDTIARYRAALEAGGVDTAEWWEPQLELALLGGLLQLGWSKFGQPEELDWWARAARRGVARL